MNKLARNAIIDSGAGVSIVDSATLAALNIAQKDIDKSEKELVDASGTAMNITGKAFIDVWVPELNRAYRHPFYILNNELNNKILLGRDFMSKIGLISFDFLRNRIRLGNRWINCQSPIERKGIRLNSKTVLPSRSESIITLRPGARSSFLQVEFEPAKLHGINGVYFSKAIVSPNVQGEINISVLNVNEVEIELAARTRVGNITRPNEIVKNKMDTRSVKISDTVDTVLIEKSLSETQRSALSEIIRKYEDIFAENSSKPKKVNTGLLQEKIDQYVVKPEESR